MARELAHGPRTCGTLVAGARQYDVNLRQQPQATCAVARETLARYLGDSSCCEPVACRRDVNGHHCLTEVRKFDVVITCWTRDVVRVSAVGADPSKRLPAQ